MWHATKLLIWSILRFILNFRDFRSKLKCINFRDIRFSQLALCAKIQISRTEMSQSINWKVIEYQYSSGCFLRKAAIKR